MLDTFENDMILSAVQQLTTEVQRVEGKANKIPVNPEIPTPSVEEAGKVLGVDETGNYALIVASGGSIYGPDSEKIYDKDFTINLKTDTEWDSWTPSTTSTQIAAQTTLETINDLNYKDYTYWVIGQLRLVPVYNDPVPTTNRLVSEVYSMIKPIMGVPSGWDNLIAGNKTSYNTFGYISDAYVHLKNASGNDYLNSSATGITLSSTEFIYTTVQLSGGKMNLTLKLEKINARCVTNFSVESAAAINSEDTNILVNVRIYKVPADKHIISAEILNGLDFLKEN